MWAWTPCESGISIPAQLVIPNTTFAQASSIIGNTLESPVDGVLGLAFDAISGIPATPAFINAVNQALVPQPIFTVYLETESDERKVDDAPAGGVFTFGGRDTTNCGDVVDWVPLIEDGWWKVTADSVRVGNTTVSSSPAQAISETGSSLILGYVSKSWFISTSDPYTPILAQPLW